MNTKLTSAKEIVICQTCGKKFVAWKNYHRQFCSRQCSGKDPKRVERGRMWGFKNAKPKVKRICQICKKEFYFAHSYLKEKGFKGKFCSRKCYGKSRLGIKSPEHSKRLSGKKRPKHSKRMQRNGNSNWQGGKSFEPYGLEFNNKLKDKIRKRDNYTCQLSEKTEKELGEKLSVHHIDYDKKNNQEINLISLSRNWNAKVNFDRKDWTNYFKEKLTKK